MVPLDLLVMAGLPRACAGWHGQRLRQGLAMLGMVSRKTNSEGHTKLIMLNHARKFSNCNVEYVSICPFFLKFAHLLRKNLKFRFEVDVLTLNT